MSRKRVVLYLSGGGMTGVFGAGVVSGLQEKNFYENIEAVYGSSCGALNGAYFLSRQSPLGSRVYYEDLLDNWLLPLNAPIALIQRLWNRYIYKIPLEKMRQVISIDYLFEIITTKKKLNVEMIKKQEIPLFIKLLNLDTYKIEFIDARSQKNLFQILKAGVSVAPYYFSFEKINGNRYIDGGLRNRIPIKYLLKKHPNSKIVIVLNETIEKSEEPRPLQHFYDLVEGRVSQIMYGGKIFNIFKNQTSDIRNSLKIGFKNNVLFIAPPKKIMGPGTTDHSKLMTTYKLGKEAANKILND